MKKSVSMFYDFVTALKQLITIGLPLKDSGSLKRSVNWLPVAGFVIGFLFCLTVMVLAKILPASTLSAVAVVGAGGYAGLLVWINERRNLNSLLKASKQLGADIAEKDKDEFSNQLGSHLNILIIIFLIFSKILVAATLIYYGHTSWLILVPVLSASALASFYVGSQAKEWGFSESQQMAPWFIALIVSVLVAQINGFAMTVVAWFLCNQAFKIIQNRPPELAKNMVFGSCELIEAITVFAGLFLLIL